jgi:hypothetical protein
MNLNRDDPTHVALLELAFAAAQLVEDLHDYQHFLGGSSDWPFTLSDVERHYQQVTSAWERFRAVTNIGALEAPEDRPSDARG